MFDQLSDRLQDTLSGVRSRGKLSEADVDRAMREIRLALLEADVNFKVVKQFTSQVRERCIGEGVLESLNPGQQVVKIVNEELASLMGGASRDIAFAISGPTVILMAGLQGSGKTTACAKLAKLLAKQGKKPALVACDTQRPAAVEQLVTMGQRAGVKVYEQGTSRDPTEIAEWALGQAKAAGEDVLIVDTAGRLHIDEELMDQLVAIRKRTKPHDVLLVLDAMTGQDAVNVAEEFASRVEFDRVGFGYQPGQRAVWDVNLNVEPGMRVAREEIFGPVLSVLRYTDEDDAVALANDSSFGLNGAVFTADLEHGLEVAARIRTGTVEINGSPSGQSAPMGGVKSSGIGRENGPEGLDAFVEPKAIGLPPELAAVLR